MPRKEAQKKEAQVIAQFFAAGLADAVRDSLKSLFSEAALPDNPFYYLAAALGAYVDQNALWSQTDVEVISALDSEAGLDVADASSKLCKLAASSCVWGLPHVLRTVSNAAAQVVHDVLKNSLPDSVFPGSTPYSASKNGYTIQLLSSVQGSTVLWRPQWLEFPELTVRCDVVIKGPRLNEALNVLAELLTSDLRELEAVPVYFVEGLRLVDPLGKLTPAGKQQPKPAGPTAAAAGANTSTFSGAGGLWRLSDMLARPDEFCRMLSREVLSGKQVVMAGVVMLEAPVDAVCLQEYQARFESCTKTYSFHFRETPDTSQPNLPAVLVKTASTASSSSSRHEVSHYGSRPYDALYEGYFMEAAAAKAYMALYQASHKAAPYSPDIYAANCDKLADRIEADAMVGSTLEAFRRLLLLVLLQDSALLQDGPLQASMLVSMELLLLSRPISSQQDMLLSTVVNLTRMLNTGAAEIQAIVRELDALMLVVEQWPRRKDACLAQAAAAAAVTPHTASSRGRAASGAAVDAVSSHAAATLAWLADHNNMEARIVAQLVSLRDRVTASTGAGIFSGISIIIKRLLGQLPGTVPATAEDCKTVLAASQVHMGALQHMLSAAALSLADALLERCRDVSWAMQLFGLRQVDSVVARAALYRDEADVAPEWVLDVDAVTETQVRAGAVAERVATEGVMLQYAVDTKLDLCLSNVYEAVTKPPLPLNPYPRLLHILRAHAAKLDLFQEDTLDVREQLFNQLMLLKPSSFIYAARPPAADNRRRKGTGAAVLRGPSDGALEDEESMTVFGSYAAITICDCRSLQGLGASLGALLSDRQWQQGSYNADVLVALAGDAALSGALALSKAEEVRLQDASSNRPAGSSADAAWSAYQHPRFFCVEVEEHHHVEGPDTTKAATLFAKGVADYVLELHQRSQHIMREVTVGGNTFQLPELLTPTGREAMIAVLAAAVSSLISRQPNAYADGCVAVVHVLAVVKEGLYVMLLKRLHFNFRQQGLPHNTANTAAAAAHRHLGFAASTMPVDAPVSDAAPSSSSRLAGGTTAAGTAAYGSWGNSGGSRRSLQDQEAEAVEPHWDLGVYQRVFLTEAAAQMWHSWNSMRGDPAQPFHYQHLLHRLKQEVPGLEAEGRLLDVHKLLLTAALATQDADTICTVSRCLQSAAQELRCLQVRSSCLHQPGCSLLSSASVGPIMMLTKHGWQSCLGLQDMSSSLQFLLAEDLHQAHASKLDGERVRRVFLTYCNRLRRALTSPKYCYFSGFAATGPGLIAELKEHVLSSSKLDARRSGIMQQLDMWTLACELSVAASIHDSLGNDVCSLLQGLLQPS